MTTFSVNSRTYRIPARPVAVLCLDGCADEYLDAALARDLMPHLQRMAVTGYRGLARGCLPSYTNVNNAAIVTGVPPSLHGISGNFFFDPQTGQEVMMNSGAYLRTPTILAEAAKAGAQVAVITAKEKLRDILSRDLRGIAFSSEKASQTRRETHGIDNAEQQLGLKTPPIYSAEASLFVLEAGAILLERKQASLLYLSLTDYIQHKCGPVESEALDFYARLDVLLGRLQAAGAVIAATADHGMNYKLTADGKPNILFLESLLSEKFGPQFRVVLPITDPYVKHHGALGSFGVVHLANPSLLAEVITWIEGIPGITEVYDRATACRKLELPEDRVGDIVVMSARDVVLGRTPAYHDLSVLAGPLRSHGGRYEEMVPFILSEPLNLAYLAKAKGDLRNFDIFDFALNGRQDQ